MNVDESNPGRCGPSFGRCNRGLTVKFTADNSAYGVYCNSDNGWCGDTAAHRDGQSEDKYDFEPASCSLDDEEQYALALSKCAVEWYPREDDYRSVFLIAEYNKCKCGVQGDLDSYEMTACLCGYRTSSSTELAQCIDQSAARVESKHSYDRWEPAPQGTETVHLYIISIFCITRSNSKTVHANPGAAAVSNAASTVAADTATVMMGSLIALMLACIAGLLCFAICARPLMMKYAQAPAKYAPVSEDLC